MTIEEIKKWMLESSGLPVTQANAEYLERFQAIAFEAGAASRDAEIQRLQFALADAEALELGTAERCDQLRAELAAALAACKVKDEALEHIALIDLGRDTLPTDFCMNVLSVRKALAIQPDDSTLREWLGEPVAWRTFDGEGGYDFRSYDDNEDYRSKWDARNPNHKSWVELLYSPKGLK